MAFYIASTYLTRQGTSHGKSGEVICFGTTNIYLSLKIEVTFDSFRVFTIIDTIQNFQVKSFKCIPTVYS